MTPVARPATPALVITYGTMVGGSGAGAGSGAIGRRSSLFGRGDGGGSSLVELRGLRAQRRDASLDRASIGRARILGEVRRRRHPRPPSVCPAPRRRGPGCRGGRARGFTRARLEEEVDRVLKATFAIRACALLEQIERASGFDALVRSRPALRRQAVIASARATERHRTPSHEVAGWLAAVLMLGTVLPKRIGRYEVLGQLAVGGMAESSSRASSVRRTSARRRHQAHLAAVRRRPGRSSTMFLDEARIVGRSVTRTSCQVQELGEDDGDVFLVLEYVAGENLERAQANATADEKMDPSMLTRNQVRHNVLLSTIPAQLMREESAPSISRKMRLDDHFGEHNPLAKICNPPAQFVVVRQKIDD